MTTDAGTLAARQRVAAVLERLERIQLGVIVVAPPDPVRLEARDRARDAAIVAGRSGLLDEATEAARASAMRIFARAGFSGTWAATEMSASVATAADRAAAAAAFEETVTAAVVDDLVDDETREILTATTDELTASSALPTPGSLASLTATAARSTDGRGGVLIPTAVVVAGVAGFLFVGSVSGAIAGAGLVAAIAWLAGRRSRPAD